MESILKYLSATTKAIRNHGIVEAYKLNGIYINQTSAFGALNWSLGVVQD